MTRDEALKVYEIQHERFRHTKELQWKINLASWALIALAINVSDKIKSQLSCWQVILVSLIFFIAQMVFSFRTQLALESDKKISIRILAQLNESASKILDIQLDIIKLTEKVTVGKTGKWWLFFQAFATGVLLLVFCFMAT